MVKKSSFIIIIMYIVISAIFLVINDKDIIKEIEILTVKKPYSRIITQDEVVDIPVFLSEEKSFFIDEKNIIDTRIKDKHNELEVKIETIEKTNKKTTYQNKSFYLFYYRLNFTEFNTNYLNVNLISASLGITFENDTYLELEIGDLNLLFTSIDNNNHLDFERMYSITNYEKNYNVIKGLYLELNNLTGDLITIESISLLNEKLYANTKATKILNFSPEYNTKFSELLPDFNSIVNEFNEDTGFSFKNKQKFLIPINHLCDWQYINRFPLIINYTYNEGYYQYIIDDYLFFSSINELGNDNYEKSIYKYKY